jgi:hypothetical protein
MKISFHKSKIPIYFLYLTFILSIINFHFESNFYVWLPEILLIFIQFILNLKYSKEQLYLISFCLILITKDLIFHQNIYILPIVSIIITSIIYLQIFKKYFTVNFFKNYINTLLIFVTLNFLFIIFEIFCITYDHNFLNILFNGLYKPSSPLYGKVPQSLYNQSQAGAQMVMVYLFFFLLLVKHLKNSKILNFVVIITIIYSLYVLLLFPNTTVYLIIILSLIIYPKLLLPNKFFKYLISFALIYFLINNYEYIINLFNYKLFNTFGEISNSYFSPITNYISNTLTQKLFGIGDLSKSYDLEADFTYGILLLKHGLLTLILLLLLIIIILKKYYIKIIFSDIERPLFLFSYFINKFSILIIFTALISLIHYPFMINFGARQFFALSISLYIYSFQANYNEKKISSICYYTNL